MSQKSKIIKLLEKMQDEQSSSKRGSARAVMLDEAIKKIKEEIK